MRAALPATLAIGLLTAASALFGVREIQQFSFTGGHDAVEGGFWPEGVPVSRLAGQPTLLLFVHPLCSCTRATLDELHRILDETAVHPAVRVFFEGGGSGVPPLWNSAAQLPNARIEWDRGGRIASRFGARTSGVIELYSAGGRLVFEGGITSARGHEGRSTGGEALAASLSKPNEELKRFPAFGCALQEDRL